jgi:hypothetical protein
MCHFVLGSPSSTLACRWAYVAALNVVRWLPTSPERCRFAGSGMPWTCMSLKAWRPLTRRNSASECRGVVTIPSRQIIFVTASGVRNRSRMRDLSVGSPPH